MHPLIDPDLQKKAVLYEKKKDLLNYIEISISGVYLFFFYISGFSSRAAALAARFSMPISIMVYSLFFIPLFIMLLPISYRRDYVVEKRFGLSSQSRASWLSDHMKGLMLGVILGYPLLLLLFFFFTISPRYWWVLGVAGLSLFQLFILIIFPVIILPLFFRQKPISDEELVSSIRELFERARMKVQGVYSFNLSTKTKKENAAIAGLWKTRRILLGDTLLERRNRDEVLIVIAHELGHHVKKHMARLVLLGLAASLILFYAVHRVMLNFPGFPENFQSTLALLPLFIILVGILSFPLKLLTNAYSRVNEREADAVALEMTGKRDAFISLMAGLANTNLIVCCPKRRKVILFYSHPPVGQRIEFAERYDL